MTYEEGSFRDRTSRVVTSDGHIFRLLNHEAQTAWETLQQQDFYQLGLEHKKLVQTKTVPLSTIKLPSNNIVEWTALLEHQPIPYISYPYEWCFSMLKDAALSQLELMEQALKSNMILKDASPYNTQWHGTAPVFIDIASFIRLPQGAAWAGYRQFCELFLFPLMLQAYKDIPFQPWLRGSLEGLAAGDMNKLFSITDTLRPGVLLHVFLQAKLQEKYQDANVNAQVKIKNAGFNKELICHNVSKLKQLVTKLQWKQKRSIWSHYIHEHTYTEDDLNEKKSFVDRILANNTYKLVWDVGCNTGVFSKIAAKHAKYVIAIDSDHLAIEHLYKDLKKENNKQILPVISDLANPSPAIGWRNRERKTIPERGRPDFIMALAVIHHMVISANIPLDDCIKWFSEQCHDLIIEFVSRDDPMVRKLLQNKDENYSDYSQEYFELILSRYFHIEEKHIINSKLRTLYYARQITDTTI